MRNLIYRADRDIRVANETTYRILCSTQRCRHRDLGDKLGVCVLLMMAVYDSLRAVNRTPTADAHDDICSDTRKLFDPSINTSDRRVFAYFPKCCTVRVARLEDFFNFPNDVGLDASMMSVENKQFCHARTLVCKLRPVTTSAVFAPTASSSFGNAFERHPGP